MHADRDTTAVQGFGTRLEGQISPLRRYARVLCRDPERADDLVRDCHRNAVRALCLMLILLASAGAAKADCLEDIGKFREQVDSQNQMRPTAQSQAASKELQKLERNEMADEMDCYNTLARARKILASTFPPPANDRYVKERHQQ